MESVGGHSQCVYLCQHEADGPIPLILAGRAMNVSRPVKREKKAPDVSD